MRGLTQHRCHLGAERRLLPQLVGAGGWAGSGSPACGLTATSLQPQARGGQALPLSGLLPQGRAPGLPGCRLRDGPSMSLAAAGRPWSCAWLLLSPPPLALPPDTHTHSGAVVSAIWGWGWQRGAGMAKADCSDGVSTKIWGLPPVPRAGLPRGSGVRPCPRPGGGGPSPEGHSHWVRPISWKELVSTPWGGGSSVQGQALRRVWGLAPCAGPHKAQAPPSLPC